MPDTYQRPTFSASSSASSTSSIATPVDIPSFSMSSFNFGCAAAPMPSPSLEGHPQFFNPIAPQAQRYNTPYGSSPEFHTHTQSAQQQQQPRYNLRSHAQRQPPPTTEPTFSSPFSQNAQPMTMEPQQSRHNSLSLHPVPSRQSSTSSTSSEAYLRDFNLLAEAAKRAQMACVTRDLEEMEF